METIKIDTNIHLEFSYTKDSTFVKVLRQGLKFPLRGVDIRIGPNTYHKDRQPQLVENSKGIVTLLIQNGEYVKLLVTKLIIELIQGIK